MKILIVSPYFWPENLKINDVAKGLVEKVMMFQYLQDYPIILMVRSIMGIHFLRIKKKIMKGLLFIDPR